MMKIQEEVLEKLIEYFERELDDPEILIEPDSNLMDDLGLSSLEMFKAMVYLESETGIVIPEKYYRKIITIKDVVDIICKIITEGKEEQDVLQKRRL